MSLLLSCGVVGECRIQQGGGVSYDDEWDDWNGYGLGDFFCSVWLFLGEREREGGRRRALLHCFGVRMANGLFTFFFPSDCVLSVFFFFESGVRNCMIGCIVSFGFGFLSYRCVFLYRVFLLGREYI